MSDATASSLDDRVIRCAGVHKHFGAVHVLRGVDLTVNRGEFVALSGASGCGKSTLLHLLAALDRPTSGTITVNGHDVTRRRALNRYRRLEIGLVFQLHNLLPRMSAARNVELAMFGTHRSSSERTARATDLLTRLDMSHAVHRSPTRLSGGERERVAIARSLANGPGILLADEPSGNLDQAATDLVLEMFDELRRDRRTTIVMITHDPAIASRADRHLRLESGVIVSPDGPLSATGSEPPIGQGR